MTKIEEFLKLVKENPESVTKFLQSRKEEQCDVR